MRPQFSLTKLSAHFAKLRIEQNGRSLYHETQHRPHTHHPLRQSGAAQGLARFDEGEVERRALRSKSSMQIGSQRRRRGRPRSRPRAASMSSPTANKASRDFSPMCASGLPALNRRRRQQRAGKQWAAEVAAFPGILRELFQPAHDGRQHRAAHADGLHRTDRLSRAGGDSPGYRQSQVGDHGLSMSTEAFMPAVAPSGVGRNEYYGQRRRIPRTRSAMLCARNISRSSMPALFCRSTIPGSPKFTARIHR